jgi:hypothetical protein
MGWGLFLVGFGAAVRVLRVRVSVGSCRAVCRCRCSVREEVNTVLTCDRGAQQAEC